jgi:hypothetical protein
VNNVAKITPREERIPPRSLHMSGDVRLIDLFAEDDRLVPLVRHLYQVHSIVTIAEFDAAGWSVINTFPDSVSSKKRRKLFHTIGRPGASNNPIPAEGARILRFVRPHGLPLG